MRSRDEEQLPNDPSYLDFDLHVSPGTGHEYPINARSNEGGANGIMRFPYEPQALANWVSDLEIVLRRSGGSQRNFQEQRQPDSKQLAVQEFGRVLFEALLPNDVRDLYRQTLAKARRQNKDIRLKLTLQPPEVAALPWEFMYDPRQRDYVCLCNTSIVRYLDIPIPVEPLAVPPPLQILGMVVSPHGLDALDVENEKRRVEAAVEHLQATGLVRLTWLPGQSWRQLQRVMRQGSWHIFHFIGHGGFDDTSGEGLIVLADDEGNPFNLPATSLARLLEGHHALRFVLLNACEGGRSSEQNIFSSTAATLINRGIPAVLAMQYKITDDAAIEFARSFYEALADTMPVDTAVAQAREALSLAFPSTVEWGTPVLYMRSPNGVLFHVDRRDMSEPTKAPSQVEEMYVKALAHFEAQRWEQAITIFGQIISQQPEYKDARSKRHTAERQLLAQRYAQGQQTYTTHAWPEAITHLEAVITMDAGYQDAAALLDTARRRQTLAELYTEARRHYVEEDWPAVVETFERINALDAAYPDTAENGDAICTGGRQSLRSRRRRSCRYQPV